MARYIDIDKAIAEIDKGDLLVGNNAEWAKEILYRMPSADVVQVVRCKDCKKFKQKGEECLLDEVWGFCEKSRTGWLDDGEEVYGNDYCSYGERKEK